jgi:two-component system response regulator YesN
MGITPNYLSSIFKASKGISFSDRLLEIRMGKASELLKEGRLSLSELSEAVGYEDIGHFRRRFKQYFGISVKDYGCINKELTLYHAKPQRRSE